MASIVLNSLLSRWVTSTSANATATGRIGRFLSNASNWTAPLEQGQLNSTKPLSLQEALLLHSGKQPSMWTFLCSPYSVVLLLVALLCNRIYNVVPPRRRNFRLEPMLRIALRMPALLLLGRSILLVLSKFAYDSEPDFLFPKILRFLLPKEYGLRDDSSVMWSVFLSLGIACLVEAFVRALNQDMRAHPSVNLLSVSYLLHFHSTPASAPVLRPTPLVYLLIALTLSEVLSLQLMDTFELNIRLIVTGIFSVFGQGAMLALLLRATNQDQDPIAMSALLPALRHLTRLSELLFFGISLMTVTLHAMAQLVVEGRITRDIFGHAARLPNMADDFSIAVMLYGTACLETTYQAGFANEVTPITAPPDPWIELKRGLPADNDQPHFRGRGPVDFHAELKQQPDGLQNEIKDIRPNLQVGPEADVPESLSRSSGALREGVRYFSVLFLIFWSIVQLGGRAVGSKVPFLRRRATSTGYFSTFLRVLGVRPYGTDVQSIYKQLQRDPDELSDDDFRLEEDALQDSSSESDEEEDRSRSRSVSVQPQDLYSDVLETSADLSAAEQTDMNNILLSHLASPSRVTRSSYSQMVLSPLQALARSQGIRPGKEIDAARMEQIETQLLCVVCRADVRRIICWPCRCLALCDTCKDTLASIPTSANSCPTCRKPVKGFSRIFIP